MPEVCLVIPCFNEEHRLPVGDFTAFLRTHPGVSICFVDDGSRDGTVAVLEALRLTEPDRIDVHRRPANAGKGRSRSRRRPSCRGDERCAVHRLLGRGPVDAARRSRTVARGAPRGAGLSAGDGIAGQASRCADRTACAAPLPRTDIRDRRRAGPGLSRVRLAVRREAVSPGSRLACSSTIRF